MAVAQFLVVRPYRAFMKIPFYTQTTGLERYPQKERLAVYSAAHKRLMREDVAYRRRWNSYVAGLVGFIFVGLSGLVIIALDSPVVGDAFCFVLSVGSVVAILYLAFRQQRFMNRRIKDVLLNEMA